MSFTQDNQSSVRDGRWPTGIDRLDEEIIRGIPKGSTIAILGDPDSSAEMVLHTLASTNRNTEYISTMRPKVQLIGDITRLSEFSEEKVKENLNIRDTSGSAGSFADIVRKSLKTVGDGNLIVDSFSERCDNSMEMQDIARHISIKTEKRDGLTYLYFVCEDTSRLSRDEKEILHLVDGVFDISLEDSAGQKVQNNMYINKLRGIDIPEEPQSLIFSGNNLTIDATTDIG